MVRKGIVRPPAFKLKDLPKYSKTLRVRERKFEGLFASWKGILKDTDSSPNNSSNGRGSPRAVEWTKTPLYK